MAVKYSRFSFILFVSLDDILLSIRVGKKMEHKQYSRSKVSELKPKGNFANHSRLQLPFLIPSFACLSKNYFRGI